MKFTVIQPPYAHDKAKIGESVAWEIEALAKCGPDADVIVLPEAADHQGAVSTPEEVATAFASFHAPLLDACAETARRCNAVVFVNALDPAPTGFRNTTFAFGRDGTLAGKYHKAHVPVLETEKLKLDDSYTKEFAPPDILEIDGVRYAFLTCYDFYFYEAYANIARMKPDVVIGCSWQRSDSHATLETFGKFVAYNTGAWLVRASVSLGEDSPLGGCSMVVAPNGEVLGNLHSRAGVLAVSFDPKSKFLKPAGFGNPPATHAEYVEAGRRPWRYRPAGSAVIPPFAQMPAKRLCAHRGFSTIAPENGMAAFGAAIGLGASEIEFDLWWTKDGDIVSIHDPTLDRVSDGSGKIWEHTLAQLQTLDFGAKKGAHFTGTRIVRFEDVLAKFSQHVIMNIHVKDRASETGAGSGEWDKVLLRKIIGLIDAYDARRHVYFMATADALQRQLAHLAPDIPRCQGEGFWKDGSGDIVDHAIANGCSMVQLFKPNFGQATIDHAKAAGLRCNVFWSDDPEEARRFLDMGIDTILTNDYQPIAAATGLK